MRIERIEIRHTKMELVSSFETSMGVERHEEHIIVRVDGEGLTGWGECAVADGAALFVRDRRAPPGTSCATS